MNDLPKPTGTAPDVYEFEAGIHFLCTCGQSGHEPLCDGSHKGTRCGPVKLLLTGKKILRITHGQASEPESLED